MVVYSQQTPQCERRDLLYVQVKECERQRVACYTQRQRERPADNTTRGGGRGEFGVTDGSELRTTEAATGSVKPQKPRAASERHLSLALRVARIATYEWDIVAHTVTTSENLAEMCGVTRIPSVAEGFTFIHPDDVARHDATIRAALTTASRYECVFRIVRPDNGRTVWLEERGEAVCDEYGVVRQLAGVLLDITGRVETEAERAQLLAAEQSARAEVETERARLRDLFTHAPAAIAALEGPEYMFTYANPRYYDLIGRSEIIGKTVREAVPEVEQQFLDLLHAVYTTGEPFVGSEIPIHLERDGELREDFLNFVYAPIRGTNGSITGIMAHVVNATAQVRARQRVEALAVENARLLAEAQAARAEAEAVRARLAAIVEQMPAGIVIAEAPSGRIVLGNAQVERMLRYPVRYSDDITRYSADWVGFHPDGRPVLPDAWPLARAITRGETVTGEEYRLRRGDGTDGWIRLDAAPIRDGAGEIVAGVVILTDLTIRKETEDALRESEARLRHALDAGAMGAWSLGHRHERRDVVE